MNLLSRLTASLRLLRSADIMFPGMKPSSSFALLPGMFSLLKRALLFKLFLLFAWRDPCVGVPRFPWVLELACCCRVRTPDRFPVPFLGFSPVPFVLNQRCSIASAAIGVELRP